LLAVPTRVLAGPESAVSADWRL